MSEGEYYGGAEDSMQACFRAQAKIDPHFWADFLKIYDPCVMSGTVTPRMQRIVDQYLKNPSQAIPLIKEFLLDRKALLWSARQTRNHEGPITDEMMWPDPYPTGHLLSARQIRNHESPITDKMLWPTPDPTAYDGPITDDKLNLPKDSVFEL